MSDHRLETFFQDYARYHRHPGNKLCHYLGIPLIIFTLVGLGAKIQLGGIDLAVILTLPVFLYHATLSPKLAAIFGLFLVACYPLAPMLSNTALWAGFVLGWVFQFFGHYGFEKNSPAFFKNLQQLLVGPLWVVNDLLQLIRPTTAPRGA